MTESFDNVTACVFANMTTIPTQIFFDDVTANQQNQQYRNKRDTNKNSNNNSSTILTKEA